MSHLQAAPAGSPEKYKRWQSGADSDRNSRRSGIPTSCSSSCSMGSIAEYVAPFSPFLTSPERENERVAVTDRYIPSRKLLRRESIMNEEDI